MKNISIGIVVVIAIVVVGYLFYATPVVPNQSDEKVVGTEEIMDEEVMMGEVGSNMPVPGANVEDMQVFQSHTISYSGSAFSPSSLTIKRGDSVTWVNESQAPMWVASAAHPTHTVYNGTTLQEHCGTQTVDAFDQCEGGAPGTSWMFTFDNVGEWKYHDHLKLGAFGAVEVVE